MPYWVYVLQSEEAGTLYTGQTSNLTKRLKNHNSKDYRKNRYTFKQKGPWRLLYSEEHDTRSDAMKREKFLKSGNGREWIKINVLKK